MTDQQLQEALRGLLSRAGDDPAERLLEQLRAVFGALAGEADGMGDLSYYRSFAQALESLLGAGDPDAESMTLVYTDAVVAWSEDTKPLGYKGVLRVQKGDRDYWAHVWTCPHAHEADTHATAEPAVLCAKAFLGQAINATGHI